MTLLAVLPLCVIGVSDAHSQKNPKPVACSNAYSGMSGNTYFAGTCLVGYGCRRSEDVCVKHLPSICK